MIAIASSSTNGTTPAVGPYDWEFASTGIEITGVTFAIHTAGGNAVIPTPTNLAYYASADYNLPGLTYLGAAPEPANDYLFGQQNL